MSTSKKMQFLCYMIIGGATLLALVPFALALLGE